MKASWDEIAQFRDEFYLDYLEPELLVPHYLIHCWLYYQYGRPMIEDHVFDALARRLEQEWDQAKHLHRKYIERKALRSGGSYIKPPIRVRAAAERFLI